MNSIPCVEEFRHIKSVQALSRSRGSLVVKVTDSWPTCHEFEPSVTEDPPREEGGRCTLNVSGLKRTPVGVVWKLGEGVDSSDDVLVS
ncbi:hypothetical protein TNCV_4403561 [Trichonephila clavipes]|uniref:Uncharacterized protein n=1 Tax=Trichonephila clavipes TaxID=2585209 RepID=A0A8X6VAR9_TRICX|nr:hypothetical protein TNCV_4403561 [Trichonephila clavipes]